MTPKQKLQNLILSCNNVTGESDTTITNAVQSLIDGYGAGVTKYSVTWDITNITPDPRRTSIVENRSFQSELIADSGFELDDNSVSVFMSGVDITSTAYSEGIIDISSVTGNVVIYAIAKRPPIDLFDVTWANHAISCGVSTWNYQGWSPHNFQYDDINDVFVFLQCHADDHKGDPEYINWSLSVINPYDATDVDVVTVPTFNGLGNLVIDNGVWYLIPRYQTYIYKSSDMGVTWETLQANVPQYLFGVYKCGDLYFGGDDKNSGRKYYTSSDLQTWTTKEFDASFGTTLCETSFCEFDGALWAFNRTNDATLGHPIILKSVDDGETWTLFSDNLLHGYRSTVSCCPFKTYIMVVDIDRDNGILYYNKFDGETITEVQHWSVPLAGDDFHNANIATNYTDTVIIEFMHGAPLPRPASDYAANYMAENVMLVGSTKSLPYVTYETVVEDTDDALAFLQNNCTFTHGGNYEFTYASGTGVRLNYGMSNGAFIDELSVPINVCCNSNYFPTVYFMDGGDFVKPHSNPLAPTYGQSFNKNSAAGSKQTALVSINGIMYATLYRPTKLPILTKCNDMYELTPYSVGANDNQIYGQSWQENLPFRKIIPLQESATASTVFGVFNNNFLNNLGTNPVVEVSYTPLSGN